MVAIVMKMCCVIFKAIFCSLYTASLQEKYRFSLGFWRPRYSRLCRSRIEFRACSVVCVLLADFQAKERLFPETACSLGNAGIISCQAGHTLIVLLSL